MTVQRAGAARRRDGTEAPPPNLHKTGWNRSFDRNASLEADRGRDGDERSEGALETDEVGGRGKIVDCRRVAQHSHVQARQADLVRTSTSPASASYLI